LKTNSSRLLFAASLLLIALSVYFSVLHIQTARQNQENNILQSEINSIRYGLLNADEWKHNLAGIISKKIEEFELTEQNKEQLKTQIEDLLYGLLDQVNKILRDDMGKIKQFLMDAFVDLDKLRENVPQLSENLLEELGKPHNKNNLKELTLQKLDSYVEETFNNDEQLKLQQILEKHNFQNKEEATTVLEQRIKRDTKKLRHYTFAISGLLLVVFLLNFFGENRKTKWGLFLLLLTSLIFLINGLAVPMIDIEAKISRINFQLIGENIHFGNQVFFYQSKSILDVVWILISNGKPDMIFVGILIFTFSVLFPVTKLISSFLTIQSPDRFKSGRFIRFFTFKSGKWSMADVMVVAIFMAFIGFDGIISDQLEYLTNTNKYIEVVTTNGTSLQSGFYLFLLFCLTGIFLSLAIQKKIQQGKSG